MHYGKTDFGRYAPGRPECEPMRIKNREINGIDYSVKT
jgi:hypothetical protein